MRGMGNMMKQAQKLQSQMLKLQEELADKTVESSSGGGMVTVVANGRQQIVSIQIEEEVVDPDDVEMLQDLVLAAVNAQDDERRHRVLVSDEHDRVLAGSQGHFNRRQRNRIDVGREAKVDSLDAEILVPLLGDGSHVLIEQHLRHGRLPL